MLDKIKNWLANKNGPPVAPDGYSRLYFAGGAVDLPANWIMTDQRNEGRWIARSPDRQIQITISVLHFAPGTVEKDCEHFAMFVVQKTQMEMSLAADVVVTRPDILVQDGGGLVAQYEGRQGSVRQFVSKMIMRRGMVVVAYVEALKGDQPWLNDVSEAVFASLSNAH